MVQGRGVAPSRSQKEIQEHYQLEKVLASRLKAADKQSRKNLYAEAYNTLFREIQSHPQNYNKVNPEWRDRTIASQLDLLGKFASKSMNFMEIGAGDCAVSRALCHSFGKVCAIDVSTEIALGPSQPPNFSFVLSDGTSIDVEPESIDVAYSYQLIEHLHPDDALEHLQNVYAALRSGGKYICGTPHRYLGPSDISRLFDDVATGFHLKEYTYRELYEAFRSVGFTKIRFIKRWRGIVVRVPPYPAVAFESLINLVPEHTRKAIRNARALKYALAITVIASKP